MGKSKAFKERLTQNAGRFFPKLSKEISIAVQNRRGRSHHESPAAHGLIEGRAANMPSDNIERAIKRDGSGEGAKLRNLTYEIYGRKEWRFWSKSARIIAIVPLGRSEAL